MALSTLFTNLVFPLRCLQCNTALFGQRLPACPVCISNLEQVDERTLRAHLAAGYAFQAMYAHWYFDKHGLAQRLHQLLKYGNRPTYGIDLGILCGRGLRPVVSGQPPPDMILPIPLHRTRYLERGYNQSTVLARGIRQITGIPVNEDVLVRPKPTRSQTGLTRHERQENVAASFSTMHPDHLNGKHVLLVDDVLTTGATLQAAAEALSAARVRAISFATLAFARP